MQTYNEIYLDVRRTLKESGVEQAQLEAMELMCAALGKRREEVLRDLSLYAGEHMTDQVYELLRRRLAGEPIAYIVGEWDFYGLTLTVTPQVLIPRPDTELLVERGILAVRDIPKARVLDLCTGSGCVGLALAYNCPNTQVVLADWSGDALKVAQQNVLRCQLADQVQLVQANALEDPARELGDFDLILCNPPYIPRQVVEEELDVSVRDYEPHMALDGGEDGLDFYRAITLHWKWALRPGGKLIFEIGYDQAPAVETLMVERGFEQVRSFRDPGGHWRVVEGVLEPIQPEDPAGKEE
ncbi:peptide chain release factor N(5)-glutamine methyltransferase [Pseudoflavonifractor capillosus]|uniref:peptide chain release factor N(5)-glutamine methyltransferase n=1 Tax=Pseudoflavonifractor capillosus TaxID=106588 RepID=UPI0019579C30|nr:peptide chain release factor N(5)-glutamine methyltransferase [Pseudoflavonifractor capillosus]